MERARGARLNTGPGSQPSARDAARPTVASFVAEGITLQPGPVTLDEEAAHHARVRRLAAGDPVTVRDGRGRVGDGVIGRIAKAALDVALHLVREVDRPPAVHLLPPVGDRDRMLWLAEKATELGVTSWGPVLWHRSRSVSPRGEGEAFARKVRARMVQALAQSEGGWLPDVEDGRAWEAVAATLPAGLRLVLDATGTAVDEVAAGDAAGTRGAAEGVCVAIGPEGGFEPDELAACEAAGFRRVRLPGNILRFETAGIVGLAFARALADRVSADATVPRSP